MSDAPASEREHHIAVTRTARLVTLGEPSDRVRELWIACHGYGQLAPAFARSLRPLARDDRYVVAPEALSRFYLDSPEQRMAGAPGRVGASWMTREDREHEIEDQVAYLDRVHAHVREQLTAVALGDGARLRLLGFSQGVATVSRWLLRGSVRPAELILWAGSVPPELDPARDRDLLRDVRLTMVLGRRDPLAEWTGLARFTESCRAAGLDASLIEFDGAHSIDAETLRRVADR